MKTIKNALSFLLITIALFSTVSTHAIDRNEYVTTVMEIFRTHVNLLQELSVAHQIKYSDNLVRHATAVRRTFGLLGPMEWHAARSEAIRSQQQGTLDIDEDMFERLANASRKSMRELVRAAQNSMEEYDRDGLVNAIDVMKQSCDNCHSLLPKSVAPDLWGPLKRK